MNGTAARKRITGLATVGRALFSTVALATCSSASCADLDSSYGQAISVAPVSSQSNRRHELHRCVRGWSAIGAKRVEPPAPNGNGVLLETGGSGFPRYEYVRIDGMMLVTSDGNQIDLTGSSLGLRLQEIYDGRNAELQGNAISAIEDENCYFLTTKGAWGINSVALYGDDGSEPSATLVRGIREAAILAARNASAEKHSTQQQSAYPHCNVYADIACFGIASGDEVTMRRPADFSLFDIRLAGGAVGTVYVGEHADISNAPFRNEAEQCIDTEKRCVFVSRANGGQMPPEPPGEAHT